MPDILADLGVLALGSRLKRLAERLQSDASQVWLDKGYAFQPGNFPLLAALDRYGPMTVSEAVSVLGVSQPAVTRSLATLVEQGYAVAVADLHDRRQKRIALTPMAIESMPAIKRTVWSFVEVAAADLCGDAKAFLDQISRIEAALAAQPLIDRARNACVILDYHDDLAGDFYTINAEWIRSMFRMEATDEKVLSDPRGMIIDRGGHILFAALGDMGVVGTCALMPIEQGVFELTKMGVLEMARGRKVGEQLLDAVLERARAMAMRELFLLTSRKCTAAIHLYEKLGFRHDADIMERFGKRYARCDVAMAYPLASANGEPVAEDGVAC